jgi:phosphoribosyl 1,2-cyclic phosphate phosphodiesterase
VKLHFLGTAGATLTPRPGCVCRICAEARTKGVPYSRLGPGLFVAGPNILFDTTEEVSVELNRAGITQVDAICYTHWHPDHTRGMRVLEQLNVDWRKSPPGRARRTTPVYLPPQVIRDFERFGLMASLDYYARDLGVAEICPVGERSPFMIGGVQLRAFQMANPSLYAYELAWEGQHIVLALDDTKAWQPPRELQDANVLVIECGWFEYGLNGELLVPFDNPVRETESAFEETQAIIRALQPRRTVLTHIEEMNARSYDDFRALERELRDPSITFAYDGLTVEL